MPVADWKDLSRINFNMNPPRISGITKMSDGSFVLQLKHDLKQGQNGGTVTNNVTWNPRTGQFTGAAWINGRVIGQLVSECYVKPK